MFIPAGANKNARNATQRVMWGLFGASSLVNLTALLIICAFVLINGLPAITWSFLTEAPTDSMTAGGIWPCILGTIILSLGTMVVAFPLGVASAIYLKEYATPGRTVRIIRLGINNLAGVPSVVFGLFGLAFFVTFFSMGVSILAGILTLGILVLPVIIGTAEEALKSVPQTYREASLGLGATKWQTIRLVVLPAAMPGMLTGAILGLSRAAGETAAIMFTASVFFTPYLPTSVFDSVMALPLMISASQEAISAVPKSVREASLALGATKWQTIWHHVLPYALPGIFTGIILSVSRAAGETAPLMLTGVAMSLSRLPDSFFDSFMALPYHIYYMATQSSDLIATRPIQYASALVLLLLVLGMNLVAIVMRKRYREKFKW
ncbi:MAG: phosphate transporter permease subunit PtsA [Methanomassiliicoccales archaeon PtaB.Bin134]|nr:MAG: phosphate transporter permease subunit PtsA [Methanomassiliicoccales archaeon PtaB.Bin134]